MTRAEAWRICLAQRVAAWDRRALALAGATTPEQEREIRARYKVEWEAAADEWSSNIDEWIKTSNAEQKL